jgi:site-specific recombinase XerD
MRTAAVGEFLVACQARGLSPRTVEFYEFFLVRLETAFTDPLSAELAAVRGMIASFSAWSVASRRGLVRTLKLFYRHCGRCDLAGELVLPRKVPVVPVVLPVADLQSLLEAVQTDPRDWAIVLMFLDTGLRVSELCALTMPDLDLRVGFAVVQNGKGGKRRMVPLGRVAVDALRVYLAGRPVGPVFLARDGLPLQPEGVRKLLKRAAARAGVTVPVYPHLLRHTSATMYLANGGDTFTLQRILGHSDLRVTEMYVTCSVGLLKERHRRASPADGVALGIQARLL